MAGFFETLRGMGGAHQRHVEVLRIALQTPDMQTARDQLAQYLQGLSGPALMGFRASLGMLMASEGHPQVQAALQWIGANLDGLREGRFRAVAPESLPAHGLTLEQVTALVTPWAQLPPATVQQRFMATLQALDARGHLELAGHLDTLAMQVQWQIGQLRQRDDSGAWGDSYEDRMAYLQARISSGERSPQDGALAQQQAILQALLHMAQAARGAAAMPAAASPTPTPPAPDVAPPELSHAQMLAELRRQLETEKAGMDPARAAALTDMLGRVARHVDADEARKRDAPGPNATLEERRADLQRDIASVAALRRETEAMREMHREVRRPVALPAGSRAAAIAPLLDGLIDDAAGQRNAPQASRRETDMLELTRLHEALVTARARLHELAPNDADVLGYERDMLRSTVHALRLYHRRGHTMLARPVWPGGGTRVEPGSAFCAGPAAAGRRVREAVAEAAAARRIGLRDAAAPGTDAATAAWRSIQGASVAVLDLSDGDPQVYYQLGQAYALGTELLLLAREGTTIPFDVAQGVLGYRDEADLAERLPAALDAALYGVQTLGLSALMHGTLARCREVAAKAVGQAHADVLLKQMEAAVTAPLDFQAALLQFLGDLGNSRLLLLHPRWPAYYPLPGEKRCFVVMPFSAQLPATQAVYRSLATALREAGVEVVRGDEAMGQDIVASIWEETARASHVLVDLTGYNLNVCLELGMADAMGRDTLLFGAAGTALARFPAIDKRRIHEYTDDAASSEGLHAQVKAFTQRAPTLL